jgi:hypothetical protein
MVRVQWTVNPEAWMNNQYLLSPNTIKKHGIDSLCGTYYVRYGRGVFHKTAGQLKLPFYREGRTTYIIQNRPYASWADSMTYTF